MCVLLGIRLYKSEHTVTGISPGILTEVGVNAVGVVIVTVRIVTGRTGIKIGTEIETSPRTKTEIRTGRRRRAAGRTR